MRFPAEGIEVLTGHEALRVERDGQHKVLIVDADGYLQTNVPNIYAAGGEETVYGLDELDRAIADSEAHGSLLAWVARFHAWRRG